MKVSLNWLNRWVDVEGIEIDELGHRLTMAGLEVDAVEQIGGGADDIVVGRIEEIASHPNADKLVVCQVATGGSELRQIGCGATNMEEGDYVPVALPGSQPPALDFEITTRELMGVRSEGMLCSAEELGLEEESEGLMILSGEPQLGEPIFDALGIRDTVFEFDLTPNRSDCLSHLGVAREVAAVFDRPLREPQYAPEPFVWNTDEATGSALEVAGLEVRDADGCPRYAFGVVEDVAVGPSPLWLKSLLASVGTRSVNNIVDVTNFILMDVGQPLHAFDLDKLGGPEIIVRRAEEGEELEAIDHNTYELDTDDLVIADRDRPVAMAGVMGGAETEVSESTDRILLECAYFDPKTVRRTSKRHGLHTESSHRFERRIDPGGVEPYLDRALRLIAKTQGEMPDAPEPTICAGIGMESVEGVDESWRVDLPAGLSRRVLGSVVDSEDVEKALGKLDLDVESHDDRYTVSIPTYRGDLRRPVDLVEEVARLYGYDVIPDDLPEREMGAEHVVRDDAEHEETIESSRQRKLTRRVRNRLLDAGLFEVVNVSFMADDQLDRLRVPGDDIRRELAEVANPLKAYERYMRSTLYPGLLSNLESNRSQKTRDVAIFEMGRRYFPANERETVGLLLAGRAVKHWSERRDWDFFDLKGIVEAAATPFDVTSASWEASELPWFHPGIQAEWWDGDAKLAEAGRLHPEIEQAYEFDGPVLLAEFYVDTLFGRRERDRRYEPISTYPPVDRDVALTVAESVSYEEIEQAIGAYRDEDERFDELVEEVELFDVYKGEQVGEEERSLAFSIRYRAADRTLTEEEVAPLDDGLVDYLNSQLDARRR